MVPSSLVAVSTAFAAIPPLLLLGMVRSELDEPGAKPCAAMLVAIVAYDLAYAANLAVEGPASAGLLSPATGWLKLFVTVPWILFALEYTGRGRLVTRRLILGLLAVPLFAGVVILSPYRGSLLVQTVVLERGAAVVTSTVGTGPATILLAAIGFVLLGVGLIVLLEFAVSVRRRWGLQTTVFAVAGLIPGVSTLVFVLELGPAPFLDLTPFAFAASATVVGYGLHTWDLFGFAPATRRVGHDSAVDDFGDAVFIVDEEARVVDVNAGAAELLGTSSRKLSQTPLSTALDTDVDVTSPPDTVSLDTVWGRRDFDVAASPIEGPRGETIGYTLVLHDVTEEKQRRQSSEVLNRILRHNLRNAMNAVEGYTRELEDHTDETGEWMLERIQQQTTDLLDLSEKARDIDRVTEASRSRTRFSVAESLEGVASQFEADSPDLTITTHVPGTLALTANRAIFEYVIRYGISSLASENDASVPRIVVSAFPTDANRPRIEVSITSNGDPIPADEREVIKRGEETPLNHSDDLDLWLVAWGVETLGGEISFIDDPERPGLSLRLPDFWGAEEDSPGEV